MTDQEIIQKVLNGDKEAYAEILTRYQRQIIAYTARLLNFHQTDAQDVASNAFVKAYINLASYNPRLKFSSWLYRIAHNEAINYMKKNRRETSIDFANGDWDIPADFNFDTPRTDDMHKILARLNTSDRNILVLFYLEEKSIKEIAEILKTSENSCKSRLSQARKKAQKIVQTYD